MSISAGLGGLECWPDRATLLVDWVIIGGDGLISATGTTLGTGEGCSVFCTGAGWGGMEEEEEEAGETWSTRGGVEDFSLFLLTDDTKTS